MTSENYLIPSSVFLAITKSTTQTSIMNAVVACLFALLAVAAAQFGSPVQPRFIPIVEHTQVKNQDGSYNLRYETGNGIAQQESSQVALNAKGEPVLHKSGSYGYTAPDGTPVSISYIADEHGFRVNGSPLPVAPAPVQAAAPVANFF